ncbi:MAG: hypothetical protein RMM58_12535 [Chloroflexota bacterium]|nr:hypothetical protein [Dehalococcoidia bacterium]MDW8254695.1 hypothetical protein [Chloroflexota bacterium]
MSGERVRLAAQEALAVIGIAVFASLARNNEQGGVAPVCGTGA